MNSYLRADARFTAFRPLLHCILLKNTKLQSKHSVIECLQSKSIHGKLSS